MATAPFCPNCYHPDPGEYCPQCGQHQSERRVTVRQLVSEFLDEQFGVNRRLPRTIKPLLFNPGRLTTDYFEGRIQQYIPPFRLYLVSSLVFFAVFALTQSSTVQITQAAEEVSKEVGSDTTLQRKLRTSKGRDLFIGVRLDASDTTTNWLSDPEVNLFYPPLSRAVEAGIRKFAVFGPVEGTRRLIRAVFAQMPTVIFVLLPLYAFLLWLFFRRQRRYYVEHFVFALHLHSFAFLAMLPLQLFDLAFLPEWARGVGDMLSPIVMLWIFVYIFIALKRVYRQRKRVIAAKYFFLWILYFVNLSIGIVLAAAVALTIA
jgi:hypothetical protein